jgi:putative redox protein
MAEFLRCCGFNGSVLASCAFVSIVFMTTLKPNKICGELLMKATIDWTGEASFKATSATGHSVQLDGPPDMGGQNRGPRPMEMVLMGLGGCSSLML